MKTKTKLVLDNLKQFCIENECCFVRSANSSNDLVLSVYDFNSKESEDVYFSEEIGVETIEFEWYTV